MLHFILGTRAQLIKTAPVMSECKKHGIDYNFIFLAQHEQTIYEIIELFGIKKPDFVLGDRGRDLADVKTLINWSAEVFSIALRERRCLFRNDKHGVALVHGDALPAILGAAVAKVAGLKVAHIEAGLRSFDYRHPFPEELIRVLIWKLHLPDFYFCPNAWALHNVSNFPGKKINTLCNTLFDSLQMALDFPDPLQGTLIPKDNYGIVTLHRFETISSRQKLEEVLGILRQFTRENRLLFILHPPTLVALKQSGLYDALEKDPMIELRPRYDYFNFIRLLKHSKFVITDGGSNQEECFYLGHPCLLLRHRTERTEGLGQNAILSKFNLNLIRHFVENYSKFRREMPHLDLRPSEMVVRTLREYW